MDKDYWNNYYKTHKRPGEPTPFAKHILSYLEPDKSLIELGCGNGRDATFFADNGVVTTGIDQALNEVEYLNTHYANEKLSFISDDFTSIKRIDTKFNYIYSRFTLHAVSEIQENNILSWTFGHLVQDGLLLLEVRSINDDLFKKGTKLDGHTNVRITSHYRRFADFDVLKHKIAELGFKIVDAVEGINFAKYKDENPVVIRIIAKRT